MKKPMSENQGLENGNAGVSSANGRQSIPLSAISELDAVVTGTSSDSESDRAAYAAFFSELGAEGVPLKVYDVNERPAEWTDVEFSDKRFRFNWAFALRTAEFTRKNAEAEACYAAKNGTVPCPEPEDSFEDFTIPEPVRSDEDVVRITKEWLSREFPEHAGLEVVYDKQGESDELARVMKMASEAMEEAKKGAFKKFPIPKKGGKIVRKVPEGIPPNDVRTGNGKPDGAKAVKFKKSVPTTVPGNGKSE